MGIFSEPSQFSEELQRDELTRVALNTGTADSDDLEQAVSELTEQQETLEQQREAAADKTEEVADAQEAAEAQTEELQPAQAEAEAELGELIREEQERRARESWERIQAEAAAAQARAEAQAAAASQAQQQASDANPTSGGNTSSGGGGGGGGGNTQSGGGNTSSGGGGGGGSTPTPAAAPAPAPHRHPSPQPRRAPEPPSTPRPARSAWPTSTPRRALVSPSTVPGLTSWAWGTAGVFLPHQSAQQYASVPHVPSSAAQPGDLIFFYSPISHVGIYIGGGMMIDSPELGRHRCAAPPSTGATSPESVARASAATSTSYADRPHKPSVPLPCSPWWRGSTSNRSAPGWSSTSPGSPGRSRSNASAAGVPT